MKKLTLSVAALTIAMMSFGQTQCKSLTKDSIQCKNTVKYVEGKDQQYPQCHLHDLDYVKPSKSITVVCSGTTKTGNKCKSKTKNTSGLCYNHKKD